MDRTYSRRVFVNISCVHGVFVICTFEGLIRHTRICNVLIINPILL